MTDCTQMRRKLVMHGSLNMATGETTTAKSEWVTEPCGAPIFGAKGETLCRSCLSGWTHPNNYPVPDEEPPQPVDDGGCDPLYGQRMDSADMGEN